MSNTETHSFVLPADCVQIVEFAVTFSSYEAIKTAVAERGETDYKTHESPDSCIFEYRTFFYMIKPTADNSTTFMVSIHSCYEAKIYECFRYCLYAKLRMLCYDLDDIYKQEQNDNDQMHKNENSSALDLSTLGPIALDLSTLGPIAIDCDYNIYNNWRLECDKPNQLKALSLGTPSEAVSKSDNTNGYVILAGYDYESEGGYDTYGYSKTLEEAKQIATESVTTGKKNKYKKNNPLHWTHVVNLDTLKVIYKSKK